MDIVNRTHVLVFCFGVSISTVFFFIPIVGFAQNYDFATVASPIIVTGEARDHDIVSYRKDEDSYKVSGSFADESMFGVIVDDPVLYVESGVALTEGARPVVRQGEAIVNVSNLGGEIRAGDIITTSPILGVGQRAEYKNATYILGFALDTMTPTGETLEYDGKKVTFGTVPTALRIGPYLTEEGVTFLTTGKEYLMGKGNMAGFEEIGEGGADKKNATAFKAFRYLLAAVLALTSIIVSIGRFGEAFKESVVSIGRNPLARAQIRSILFWNIILIIFVSGAGLIVSAALILAP